MNKKYFLSMSLFAISILVLTLNFWFDSILPIDDEITQLSILGAILSYVVIYFIFIIIVQNYSRWKKFFYVDTICFIRRTVHRDRKLGDEIFRIFSLSLITNFFIVYFLLITTPNQIISRIPGFEGINLFTENSDIEFFEMIGDFTRIDYFMPLTILGIVVLYILRFIHQNLSEKQSKFPGTNLLLGFFYSISGIIIIQIVLIVSNVVELGMTLDDLIIRLLFAVFFTMFGILSIPVAIALDRLLLKDLKLL